MSKQLKKIIGGGTVGWREKPMVNRNLADKATEFTFKFPKSPEVLGIFLKKKSR